MKTVFIFVAAIVLLVGFLLITQMDQTNTIQNIPTPSPTSTAISENVNIEASFTIITGSITRSFKAEKYHNLSPDVYIEASDPTIVHVKKAGTRWDDFFKTLPMKLTKECLTTGDGETFCDGKDLPAGRQGGKLKFFLNDMEDKDLLDKEIKEGSEALIKFTSL